MPEVHEPWTWTAGRIRQPCGFYDRVEGFRHDGVREPPAAAGHKHVRIMARHAPPSVQVAVQRHPGRLVQREQAAFLELTFSDGEPLWGDIAQLERPRFCRPHACRR